MLEIRPIVVNEDMVVLGGNMRLKACQEAGLKEVPVIQADELSAEQQREFIVKDNVGFGEWDWDMIANEWDTEKTEEWGLDVWLNENNLEEPDFNELTEDNKNKPPTIKITFRNVNDLENAEEEIAKIINKYEKAFYSVSLEK